MANLVTAPQRAETITGQRSAARMYADIDYELALGEVAGADEDAGETALQILERRFPGIKQHSSDVVAHGGHTPNLSRKAGENLAHGGRRRRSTPRSRARPAAHRTPPPRASSRPSSSPASRVLDASLPTVPSAITSSSGSQLLVQIITWGMGLSLLYLSLTHDKAATGLFSGAANVTRSVVSSSIDPLNPHYNAAAVHLAAARAAGRNAAGPAAANAKLKQTVAHL